MDALSDFLSTYRPVSDLEHIPSALIEKVDILSCLKHRDDRQVLLLRDRLSGTRLIMKIVPLEQKSLLGREEAILRRLHDEAFPHPVICFEYGTKAFLLREYVPGRSLSELVEDEGPLAEDQAVALALKVCGVVGRLHGCTPPVIHRDIKPQNLILSPDGSLHLVDLDAAEDVCPEKTTDTVIMGTVATAAPEQFGFRRCDERTDVYAIGMLLVYLLSGEYALSALKDVLISKPLRRIMDSSLQFDPRKRADSVNRLAEHLSSRGRHNAGRLAGVSGVLLALVLAAALLFSAPRLAGFIESANAFAAEPAYAFASPLIEQAVRLQLNKPRGRITNRDLRVVTELDLCGETPFVRWEELDSRGRSVRIGGAPIDGGAVLGDGSDLQAMPNLRRLSLYRLSIQDIGFLAGLPLTHLGLGGNRIGDLSALSDCKLLQVLDVSDNPIQNLDALSGCPLLASLDISATGVVGLLPLEGMKLKSLELFDLPGGADYSVLSHLNGLEVFGIPEQLE